ncbi:MAG: hypothetical protein WC729_29270 [Sphingomonas sp.]
MIFGDYEAKYDATLRGELVNAGTPDAVRAVVKKYICRGWLFPQMKAALDQVKDRMKGNFYNVAVAYATVHLLIQARDDREIAASIKCPQPIRGGIYDNIRCSSNLKDRIGNARDCDTHDLTDYDIHGVAQGWWNLDTPQYAHACASKPAGCAALLKSNPDSTPASAAYYQGQKLDPNKTCCVRTVNNPPRLDYCGDLYGPRTGDRASGMKTKDGREIYISVDNKFFTLGGEKCRRAEGKDWRVEEAREVVFLLTFDQLLREGRSEEAYGLMHAFFLHKSTMRFQWVTKVPGFVTYPRPAVATNGRYTYVAARYRYMVAGQEATSYFYLPNDPLVLRQYLPFRIVNWGDYGKPGYVVAARADPVCQKAAATKAVVDTVKWIQSFITGGVSVDSLITTAVGIAVKAGTQAYMKSRGGAAAAMADNTNLLDFSMGMSGLVSQWNDIEDTCVAVSERKAAPYREQLAKTVRLFTDPIWVKIAAEKKAAAPAASSPPPPPKKSNWVAAIAGAAAGAVAGGPVGGVVGAVAAAMLTRKK